MLVFRSRSTRRPSARRTSATEPDATSLFSGVNFPVLRTTSLRASAPVTAQRAAVRARRATRILMPLLYSPDLTADLTPRRALEGGERRLHLSASDAARDEDEPRAPVAVRPRVEVLGRVDDVLDAVQEDRSRGTDVEQALDAQDVRSPALQEHRQPDAEGSPVELSIDGERERLHILARMILILTRAFRAQ